MSELKNVKTRSKHVEGYMCRNDFVNELDAAFLGRKVYSTIAGLRHDRKDVALRGIIKVTVTATEVIE